MEPSDSNIKIYFIFSYMLGNENPEKISYISGNSFPSLKNEKKPTLKKLLIFRKMELTSPFFSKKKFLNFRNGTFYSQV